MEDFFKADGLSRIIFYFQEVENLPEAGNLNLMASAFTLLLKSNRFYDLSLCNF